MPALRILLVPAILLASVFGYVAVNPGGATVENPDATSTPRPTATPTPPPQLPAGVSGRLTYRTFRELVTVQLPDVTELSRVPVPPAQTVDANATGAWWTYSGCDQICNLQVRSEGVTLVDLNVAGISVTEWSPARARFAAAVRTNDGRNQVVVIEGDATPSLRVLSDTPDIDTTTFIWLDDTRLLLSAQASGVPSLYVLDTDGQVERVAELASSAAYLYPSPDRSRALFTQSAAAGWQLWMFDATTRRITNLGNMGSDPKDGDAPVESSPENTGKGGPMYISWAPDGEKVAFGGGFEPPYIMTTVRLDTGSRAVTEFTSGYPGEIRWTADSSAIGVSTYDIERTHHETWVIDPDTGVGRYLMDGCVIVWSPDGRFLAVHGEDVPGIGIVDVASGAIAQLTHEANDAPLRWTE